MSINLNSSIAVYLSLIILGLSSCGQLQEENMNVGFFKGTEAYILAQAVEREDLSEITNLLSKNPELLKITNPTSGSNVLALCLYTESFNSFNKLLELGADPNFINPYTNHSVLMDAIKPFGDQFEWREENKYANVLLSMGADPNYVIEGDFTNEKGNRILATSPLYKASSLNLAMVKSLISNGVRTDIRIGQYEQSPLGKAIETGKFDIAEYYIDSLDFDIREPLYRGDKETLFIQDYTVTRFTKAQLKGDSAEIARILEQNPNIENASKRRWNFIQKLEGMGIDFTNYSYSK